MTWPYLKRKVGVVLLIVILGGLLLVSLVWGMYQNQVLNTNYGFGPEWNCIGFPKGGSPICMKRVTKTDKSN
jgi:hypothetical protein